MIRFIVTLCWVLLVAVTVAMTGFVVDMLIESPSLTAVCLLPTTLCLGVAVAILWKIFRLQLQLYRC